jgi:hypothetical protein
MADRFDDPRLRYGIPLALDVGAVGLAVTLHDRVAAYQASARFTARVSLALFVVLALLHALPEQRERARKLMTPFAAAHIFHFVCLVCHLQVVGTWPEPTALAGGALAYLLIVAMPVLQLFSARISARARAVAEQAYLGWVGFIFLMAYLSRVTGKLPRAGGSLAEHQWLFATVLATLAAYLTLRLRARRPATGTARAEREP